VQVIPHITNEIKARIRRMATGSDGPVDVVITEVGGTVGDIESLPFLESIRQVRHDVGRDNVFFLHISLVPYIGPSGELKTKPTQHSVAALRSIGIAPDAIVCRADRDIPAGVKRKISLMCDVDEEAVVAAVDAPSIYDIPKVLHAEGLDAYVVRRLGLPFRDVDWRSWDELLRRVHRPAHEVTVALVGKYIDLPDAISRSPRRCAPAASPTTAGSSCAGSPRRLPDRGGRRGAARGADAVCIPGGFGVRGIEGKVGAVRYARENQLPTLGLCLGLQCMVIEFARNVAGLEGADSMEFDGATPHPVIATMSDQRDVVAGERDMGGTMRLGLYPAKLADSSLVRDVYGAPYIEERHRHRYEVNNAYRAPLEEAGLVFSGTSPDGRLVEFVELPRDVHPYFVATQAHPSSARGRRWRTRCSPGWSVRPSRTRRRRPSRSLRSRTSRPSPRRAPEMHEWREPVRDEADMREVVDSVRVFEGLIWSVRTDTVDLGDGQTVVRDLIEHPGAVGIIAMDEQERVLLVRQYRHPVRSTLWEPPAGLMDVDGEDPLLTAQRELFEEAHLQATDWRVLVDYFNSPGGTSEVFRCYLARGVRAYDGDRHAGTGEERDMPYVWVPLDEAVTMALDGRLHNPTAVCGVKRHVGGAGEGRSNQLRRRRGRVPERSGVGPTTTGILRRLGTSPRHRLRATAQGGPPSTTGSAGESASTRTCIAVKVGIPREVKNHEYRVAITPPGCTSWCAMGTRSTWRRRRATARPSPTTTTASPEPRSWTRRTTSGGPVT
jgi:CTP synthase